MSGGSQHNPNGRQSQLNPGWSPLQLQMANLLARAPQAHMASDRGVTWHTPTPPPHLYHVPAPSPPDPLQAMKNAAGNSVFRHTATPPELFRHTPTPPDKHLIRHTPSPGDVKAGAPIPPAELYPHLGPGREKLVRAEELLAYARVGVDLSLGGRGAANGAAAAASPLAHAHAHAHAALPASPALSVRDAPTINSLIARAQPRHAHAQHARVDALLERLAPSPVSPHSVIVHSRAAPTPSPPSSNEDSTDSTGAPPGSKRKRKPERTVRMPSVAGMAGAPAVPPSPLAEQPRPAPRVSPPPPEPEPAPAPQPQQSKPPTPTPPPPVENGDTVHAKTNGPEERPPSPRPPDRPPVRRKSRSGSAETIADIAAMIASTDDPPMPERPATPPVVDPEPDPAVTVDKLKSVLASPEPEPEPEPEPVPPKPEEPEQRPPSPPAVETAAAPKRRSARTSNSESTNVPVESPSEAKPAEPETSETRSAEPTAASFVEVENQLEKMFAGLEEEQKVAELENESQSTAPPPTAKRRKSTAPRADRSRKPPRKKSDIGKLKKKETSAKDAYDSGSNASSSRSRGPYIQIRGPRDSPVSVSVMNASTGEEEDPVVRRKGKGEEFRNGARLGGRGLHASTLGLRYDASTPDLTWLCAFCQRGPHAASLGDLFGPYQLDNDCEEYRALDEASRRRYDSDGNTVWFHMCCAVWAPGLVAWGARLWGLGPAVWGARGARCACGRGGAALACHARGCPSRTHLPCAAPHQWRLDEGNFRALCPRHA